MGPLTLPRVAPARVARAAVSSRPRVAYLRGYWVPWALTGGTKIAFPRIPRGHVRVTGVVYFVYSVGIALRAVPCPVRRCPALPATKIRMELFHCARVWQTVLVLTVHTSGLHVSSLARRAASFHVS